MKKQEVIDNAYGNYADIAKRLRDENGWIIISNYYTYFPQDKEVNSCGNFYRPKSLHNIENNNGWNKLENEKDLPERNNEQVYYWIHEGSIHEMRLDPCHYDKPKVILSHYTHWRKKEEIPYPIF